MKQMSRPGALAKALLEVVKTLETNQKPFRNRMDNK